jgi:UDP-N-acetyl-2-amino-2-deoxyglucuronate dehydrogenase
MNQASHYVDLLDWLVGPVDSVHAYTATLARNIEAEDTGVMSCAAPRRLASINVTMLTHARTRGQHHLLGETRHGADRRRRGQQDRALGIRRAARDDRAGRRASYGTESVTGTATRSTTTTSSGRCAARRTPPSTATKACVRSKC